MELIPNEMFEAAAQFGVAGLMGVLWVWERMHSRTRDSQLSEAHQQLINQRERLGVLVELVRHHSETLEQLNQTQNHFMQLLESMRADWPHTPRQDEAGK